ncbi:MAG: hypothetical protein LBG97_10360 [Coriobacteriales bacterium]|nr:hypothetical protein [Coriobacteriales bacterium]
MSSGKSVVKRIYCQANMSSSESSLYLLSFYLTMPIVSLQRNGWRQPIRNTSEPAALQVLADECSWLVNLLVYPRRFRANFGSNNAKNAVRAKITIRVAVNRRDNTDGKQLCWQKRRKEEQRILQMCCESAKSEFVAVYGRRRIGKTYLVKEFLAIHVASCS